LEPNLSQIADGCRKGEQLMQKQLYEFCYTDMMKICIRYTKDIDKSAIVFNDAMLKVFKSIGQYDEKGKIMAWIKKIVVNTAIDYVRIKSNFLPEIVNKEDIPENFSIDESVFEKMNSKDIQKLINNLPAKLAIVFNLYVYEEYDHNDISSLLKIPAGTSRYYLSEARKKLREIVLNPISSLNNVI
jgi:RNA polymerase sigma-70 factor (ECF subfamily)